MIKIERIIQDIADKGWSYQPDVLTQEQLKLIALLFTGEFSLARVGKNQNLERREEIRGDSICWMDPLNPAEVLKDPMQFLNELKQSLNQNFYLGLKDFECHLAKYPVGSFYKKHLDRFENDSSRSFTFIFYVHEEWNEGDGGELVLYNKEGAVLATILPEAGSLLCFISEDFPHEVKTTRRERRTFTGWMHTKILT